MDSTTQVSLFDIPRCSWCHSPAQFDFVTKFGMWGYGCSAHYQHYRQHLDLGVNKGRVIVQKKLITKDTRD